MKINVKNVARLANLPLTESEEAKFEKQLTSILDYVAKLDEVAADNVEPTSQVTGLENITKKDIPAPSLSQEEVLSNSRSQHNGLFKVEGIFKDE